MKKDYIITYYRPMLAKTFEATLSQFITREFPFLKGTMVINLFVREVAKLVEKYYPPTSYLRPGQMVWIGVDKDDRPGYTKSIAEAKTRPVVLTLLNREDILNYLGRMPPAKMRQHVWVRLFKEAYEKGVVLSAIDVASIFKFPPNVVARSIRTYEHEHDTIVPRRGTIHDLGRSVSHKTRICRKKLIEGKSTSQVARETYHSPEAVDRYLKGLSQVIFCMEKGMDTKEASFVTSMNEGLVKEYARLAKTLEPKKMNRVKRARTVRKT